MSKIKCRIEIAAFRRRRLAVTGSASNTYQEPPTTDFDESLVKEITTVVKRLTGDSPDSIKVRQAIISTDEDAVSETQ